MKYYLIKDGAIVAVVPTNAREHIIAQCKDVMNSCGSTAHHVIGGIAVNRVMGVVA